MRVRPVAFLAVVFGAAVLTTLFVVRQLPREGQVTPALAPPPPPAAAVPTPPLDPPASVADGALEIRALAGPEPLSGADVRAYLAIPPAPGAVEPSWRRAGEARTGAGGVARLPARPGAYLVVVRAGGLAPAYAEAVRVRGEDATRADVVLAPPASLAGRIAVKPGGTPARARVTALPLAGTGPRVGPPSVPPEEQVTAVADASGAFRLDGLAPGAWALTVEAAGLHPASLPRVAVPRAEPLAVSLEPLGTVSGIVRLADRQPAAGASVRAASRDHGATATAGADGRFSLPVPAGRYVVLAALGERAGAAQEVAVDAGASSDAGAIALGPAARIEGALVEQETGRPAARGEVVVVPHETGEVVGRAVAGDDGRFAVAGLAPGAYDLRAGARGRTPALVRGVTLAPGAVFPARISLAGTGVVEGLVRDASGRALGGVRVRVISRGDGLDAPVGLEARTGFDGRYRIDAVEAGRAELVAQQEAEDLGVAASVRVQPGDTSRADLDLPEAGVLSGRVLRDGKPAGAGLAVVAVPMRARAGTLVARAMADGTGNYRLVVPEGEYRVHAAPAEAERTDLRVAPVFVRVRARQTTVVDVPAARAAADEGTELVVLEPGGAPSPGAVVTIARAGDDRVALATSAGEDGRVVIAKEMGLEGRPVTVRARNGGRSGAWTGTLPASGAVPVTLAPGGAVVGVVKTPGPAPRAFTLEVASEPAPASWRTLDVHRFAGERFDLGDLPTDPVRLTVVTDDGRRGSAEVRLQAGETRKIEIALDRR